jgi:hypothetical protein
VLPKALGDARRPRARNAEAIEVSLHRVVDGQDAVGGPGYPHPDAAHRIADSFGMPNERNRAFLSVFHGLPLTSRRDRAVDERIP